MMNADINQEVNRDSRCEMTRHSNSTSEDSPNCIREDIYLTNNISGEMEMSSPVNKPMPARPETSNTDRNSFSFPEF